MNESLLSMELDLNDSYIFKESPVLKDELVEEAQRAIDQEMNDSSVI